MGAVAASGGDAVITMECNFCDWRIQVPDSAMEVALSLEGEHRSEHPKSRALVLQHLQTLGSLPSTKQMRAWGDEEAR